ncbi:toxin Doc [bacterium BMS3Bbin11]|nr:toxin Doc [bacterium BMS3Abin11]GBE46420.1 toxin Doc [bacterium BMS3Bbin11]HDH14868.1 type II toxin-antitoxin system death-on-curing family toxin [Gammaproteobacteria bacterium]HDZ78322.1 type II toxin-antitoxin system death-on-curing family toxin [Gammaproteobacteria bacterium]
MTEPHWVLGEIVVAVHQMLIAEHNGSPGIQDVGLLESALVRPRQIFSYDPKATIFDLAAGYGFGLAKNHPFIDGNKRTALSIVATFLEINGYNLDAPEPESVIIFGKLAAGDLSETELSKWLCDFSIYTA